MIEPRIILVDTSYPINTRNKRIIDSLKERFGENTVKYVTWLRESGRIREEDKGEYIYSNPAALGSKIEKLKSLPGFASFVKKSLDDFKPNIIIASHWDSLLICSRYKKEGQYLIYENLDIPTGRGIVRKIATWVESLALKKTDLICHASRFYPQLYGNFKKEQIVVENKVPCNMIAGKEPAPRKDATLVIMFNGGLRYADTMFRLFEAVGDLEGVTLSLHGGANGSEGERILKEAGKYKNIICHGRYDYSSIPILFGGADVVWAVYPAEDFNVKYAISNKYHECLLFGVPGIYARDTCLGDFVEKENIGFAVDSSSVESIRELIISIRDNRSILDEKKAKLRAQKINENQYWEDEVAPLMYSVLEFNCKQCQ